MEDFGKLVRGENSSSREHTVESMMEDYRWAVNHLGVSDVRPPDPDVMRRMIAAGWTDLECDVPVTNCVCTGKLRANKTRELSLNLQSMAPALRMFAAQINIPNFPAITFPITGYINVRAVLFSTGFLIITGFRVRIEMLYALEYVRRLLYTCGYTDITYNIAEFRTQNVVARKILPASVNKDKFKAMNMSSGSTKRFPGLCVQFIGPFQENGKPRSWTVLVFGSPRCVFVGWKTPMELRAMVYLIAPMLFLATEDADKHP